MTPITFRCQQCGAEWTSRSTYLNTSEKQLHQAGWISVVVENGHVDRLCPGCKEDVRKRVTV